MHNYDILIHPSRYEGFGLAIIEGIAAGVPVIASDVDGPAELLFDKPTGYLFKAGDADHLALVIKKVIKLLSDNNIKELCNVSRNIAHNQYSVHLTASEYLKRYVLDVNNESLKFA